MDRNLLRDFLALLLENAKLVGEIGPGARDKPEKLRELLAAVGGWGHFYEVPFPHLLAAFVALSGMRELVEEAAASQDPNRTLLDLVTANADGGELDALPEEEQAIFVVLVFSIIGNINARRMYNRWLSELVADVQRGDDEALFKAVAVDRVAVQSRPVARRIGEAQIMGDKSFMKLLAKAITRTRPRRPKPEYDAARYLLDLIEELYGRDNPTHEQIYDILVDDLQVYPDNGMDPMSGLKKLIQKRNKQARK